MKKATTGAQGLNVNDAIAGEWSPVAETDDAQVSNTESRASEKEVCSDDKFAEFTKETEALVRSKKITAKKALTSARSLMTLTPEQEFTIDSWAQEGN